MITFSIILLILLLIANYFCDNKDYSFIRILIGISLIGVSMNLQLHKEFERTTITPMDVYKGNTKLEYKGYYDDGVFIKTDSVVVLINEKTK